MFYGLVVAWSADHEGLHHIRQITQRALQNWHMVHRHMAKTGSANESPSESQRGWTMAATGQSW